MSRETFRVRLYDTVDTAWATKYPTYPIQWENHKMNNQPDGPWLDVDIKDTLDSERTQLGRKYFVRKYGIVDIAVHVVESVGTKELNEMVDFLDQLLSERSWTLSDGDHVIFKNMVVKHTRLVDGYYYTRVLFDYDRTQCFNRS